MMSWIRLLVVQ